MASEETLSKLDLYFFPISIQKLHPNSVISFDLYIKTHGKYVLYKNKNLVIDEGELKGLQEKTIDTLYAHNNDKKNFKTYQEGNIENFLNSENVPVKRKAEALYESAINVVEDVFTNPRSGEAVQRSREIVGHTVDFIVNAPRGFANLLKIRKHDFYTYTHSVNVCTFLISLAQEIGVQNRKMLFAIAEGGLLHDLGKSQVPSSVINKRGQLNKAEWEVMQKHPTFGVEIAKETRTMSPVSVTIIGQHHEKMNGKGYPGGLSGKELNQFANMASIVDVYDALTTNRSYSPARPPTVAAQILLSGKDEFNMNIVKTFLKMLAVKGETK